MTENELINPNEREHPKAPELDMSKIANLQAIESTGDDTIKKAQGDLPRTKKRKKGKFNFITPEKVPLPSGGRLYGNVTTDEDVLNGFVYMYPMTVKEEEILSTSRFLKSGAATRMVIDNCIASDIDAKDILLFDSNFLLFYLRSISYGDEYKFKLKCKNPSCEQEFDHSVHIKELGFEELPEDIIEPIKIKLSVGYEVSTILPRLHHSEDIYQRNLKKKKSTADSDSRIADNLLSTIVSIKDSNGELVGRGDYEEFLEALPGRDRADIKEATEFSTGVDTLNDVICPYCSTDYSGSIPIGAEFFRL